MGLPWRRAKAKAQMLAFISLFSVFFFFFGASSSQVIWKIMIKMMERPGWVSFFSNMICFFYFRTLAGPPYLWGANIKTGLRQGCSFGSLDLISLYHWGCTIDIFSCLTFNIHSVTGFVSFIFTHYHPTYEAPTLRIDTGPVAIAWRVW